MCKKNKARGTCNIEIKPIRSEKDYEEAMKIIESLLDCAPKSKDENTLELRSIVVNEYEKIPRPIGEPGPIEYLKYLIEETNLSKKELAKNLGGENRVSEVLNRKRPLTLKMIKNLHHHLHISAATLLTS